MPLATQLPIREGANPQRSPGPEGNPASRKKSWLRRGTGDQTLSPKNT